ncbi:MotA/TolQ/ExbB proton channel family protein [Prosthecobacter sp. SYSU 5D2]|uniref:MotA/TolQ/ExbB proton channel family protein n=1 Tax=Prosthecobacter sp. SYSU 5D2 TaxID=3134134 RepID=UPI0031FED024
MILHFLPMKASSLTLFLALVFSLSVQAQNGAPLAKVADDFQDRLDTATKQLAETRKKIEAEKVPMTKQLNELDDQIIEARKEYDRVLRISDSRTLDITNLKAQIKAKEDQTNYVSNILDEFIRNFETRIHISEAQRYGDLITDKKNAAANGNLSVQDKLQARLDVLNLAMDRLEESVGGVIFDGSAVEGKSGVVSKGEFLVLGPLAFFAGEDGKHMGLADLRLGSNEPAILTLPEATEPENIRTTIAAGEGRLPIDATRGSAFKVEETKMTIKDEFLKGGPVMWPIGILGAVAMLIGLVKWMQLIRVKRPSYKQVTELLAHLDAGRTQQAEAMVKKVGGPVGKMLAATVKHYTDPASMMEESMFERVLDARTKLNSYIPFIKIAAAVEPLLGLLGTVTGMINTFKLITVFGTSDASTFSSGISEALLTTEWGLITAIPCLLMAAYLARLARAAMDDMEKLGVRIMNHRNAKDAGGSPPSAFASVKPAPQPSPEPEPLGLRPITAPAV